MQLFSADAIVFSKKIEHFFDLKKVKKQASKVAHNRPNPFFHSSANLFSNLWMKCATLCNVDWKWGHTSFCITHADISILFDLRLFKVTVESPISEELCIIKNVRSDLEAIILKPDPMQKHCFHTIRGPNMWFFYFCLFIAWSISQLKQS